MLAYFMTFVCVVLILRISLSLTARELQRGLTAGGLGPGVTDGPGPRAPRGRDAAGVALRGPHPAAFAVCALGR